MVSDLRDHVKITCYHYNYIIILNRKLSGSDTFCCYVDFKVVPESKNGKEEFGCIIVNIMYCTAKLGYVEEVYFVNMLQGN